ncbi:MAG: hypothetical protein WCO61_03135 [Alphaproteobacteria bacterium]
MDQDNEILTQIGLSHGQARWVLRQFDLTSRESDQSFDALLKSLRRDGIPFADDEVGRGAGFNLIYKFEHLMELALIFAFRTQGFLSRDFVRMISKLRGELRPHFRRAYLERNRGLGARVKVHFEDVGVKSPTSDANASPVKPLEVEGTYLDLAVSHMPGGVIAVRRCELLGPKQAVRAFMARHSNMYPQPPLPISDIAADIVRIATSEIPKIHRGRP